MENTSDFSVIKQKIINTHEVFVLYNKNKNELEKLHVLYNRNKKELEKLQNHCRQLKKKLQQSNDEKNILKLKYDNLTFDYNEKSKNFDPLQKEHDQLKIRFLNLEGEYNNMVNDWQIKYQSVNQELIDLQNKFEGKEVKKKIKQKSTDDTYIELKKQNNKLSSEKERLVKENSDLRLELHKSQEHRSKLGSLKEELDALKIKYKELEKQKDNNVKDCHSKIENSERRMDDLNIEKHGSECENLPHQSENSMMQTNPEQQIEEESEHVIQDNPNELNSLAKQLEACIEERNYKLPQVNKPPKKLAQNDLIELDSLEKEERNCGFIQVNEKSKDLSEDHSNETIFFQKEPNSWKLKYEKLVQEQGNQLKNLQLKITNSEKIIKNLNREKDELKHENLTFKTEISMLETCKEQFNDNFLEMKKKYENSVQDITKLQKIIDESNLKIQELSLKVEDFTDTHRVEEIIAKMKVCACLSPLHEDFRDDAIPNLQTELLQNAVCNQTPPSNVQNENSKKGNGFNVNVGTQSPPDIEFVEELSRTRTDMKKAIETRNNKSENRIDLLQSLIALKEANINFWISNESLTSLQNINSTAVCSLETSNLEFVKSQVEPLSISTHELCCTLECCNSAYVLKGSGDEDSPLLGFLSVKSERYLKNQANYMEVIKRYQPSTERGPSELRKETIRRSTRLKTKRSSSQECSCAYKIPKLSNQSNREIDERLSISHIDSRDMELDINESLVPNRDKVKGRSKGNNSKSPCKRKNTSNHWKSSKNMYKQWKAIYSNLPESFENEELSLEGQHNIKNYKKANELDTVSKFMDTNKRKQSNNLKQNSQLMNSNELTESASSSSNNCSKDQLEAITSKYIRQDTEKLSVGDTGKQKEANLKSLDTSNENLIHEDVQDESSRVIRKRNITSVREISTKTSFKKPVCRTRQSSRLAGLKKRESGCVSEIEISDGPQSLPLSENSFLEHTATEVDQTIQNESPQVTKRPRIAPIKQKSPKTSFKKPVCRTQRSSQRKKQTIEPEQSEYFDWPESPPMIEKILSEHQPKIIPLEQIDKEIEEVAANEKQRVIEDIKDKSENCSVYTEPNKDTQNDEDVAKLIVGQIKFYEDTLASCSNKETPNNLKNNSLYTESSLLRTGSENLENEETQNRQGEWGTESISNVETDGLEKREKIGDKLDETNSFSKSANDSFEDLKNYTTPEESSSQMDKRLDTSPIRQKLPQSLLCTKRQSPRLRALKERASKTSVVMSEIAERLDQSQSPKSLKEIRLRSQPLIKIDDEIETVRNDSGINEDDSSMEQLSVDDEANHKVDETVNRMPASKIENLFLKLINFPKEELLFNEILQEFSKQDPHYVAAVVLERISKDYHDAPDTRYHPAPMMTETQRIMLVFMWKLDQVASGVVNSFLTLTEQRILTTKLLEEIAPISRVYLALCKLQKDLYRMRKLCCDVFYFCGDFAVPFLFIVLTSWAEILPKAGEAQDIPLARVLVQIVYMKDCNKPGYNLMSLRDMLIKFYEYPTERWDSNELFQELFNNYLSNPVRSSDFALLLLCKNHPDKWVYDKIEQFFKPLVEKIPTDNFKAAVIILIGNLSHRFSSKAEVDYINPIKKWLLSLVKGETADVVKRSVFLCLKRLKRK